MKCPQCGQVPGDYDTECGNCGRSLEMTEAEETAWTLHRLQEQSKPVRNELVATFARLLATGLLLVIGIGLVLTLPGLGAIYFGVLIVIALVRVLLK